MNRHRQMIVALGANLEALDPLSVWRGRALRLARLIAPKDLPDNLYLLFTSELPRAWHKGDFYGVTGRGMTAVARTILGTRWRGPGPVIVINDVALREDFKPQYFDLGWLPTWLHELAHLVVEPNLCRPMPAAKRLNTAALVEMISRPVSEAESLPNLLHHGPDFIRVGLHLAYRASRLLGHRLNVRRITGSPRAPRYEHALGEELERYAHRPLSFIQKIPASERFQSLWLDDVTAQLS